jgi:hypothetical protein
MPFPAVTMPFKNYKDSSLGDWDNIHNISFSLQIVNWPKKLACYITLDWKGLPRVNTLVHYKVNEVFKILLLGQYSQHFIFFVNCERTQKANVLHNTRLKRLAKGKLSSLLQSKWSVKNFTPWSIFPKLNFLSIVNGPKKLACYITLDWKGLPGTNTQVYWTH